MLEVDGITKVLEIGAGTGRITEKYALETQLTIASDYSFSSLLLFKNSMPVSIKKKVHVVQADGTASPFRDAVFDRVLAAGVFMHIRGAEMRDCFLNESNRALGPKGSLIITGKNYNYFYRRQGGGKKKEDVSRSGIYMFSSSKSEFVDLLKRHFIVKRCRGFRYEIPKITKESGENVA
jgi:ubiquinone/menaquinone biosynthesis C-methylase UbiE